MNGPCEPQPGSEDRAGIHPGATTTPTDAARLERRRLLLKGLGKGAAVAAAAMPLQSLATTTSLTASGHLCSVSGTQSAVRSNSAGLPTCGGHPHTKWCSKSNWPDYDVSTNPNGRFTCTESGKVVSAGRSCTFISVFGGGTSGTVWAVLNGTAGTAAERQWVCALLNARKCMTKAPSMNFPYTTGQVIALYSSPQASAALSMFSTHLVGMP